MYKVLTYFTDKDDKGYAYHSGDIFPREGMTVTEERLKELSTKANKKGKPVIKEVKEKKDADTDMSRDSELVQQESADNKRKNTNRKRTNNTKRVSGKDSK